MDQQTDQAKVRVKKKPRGRGRPWPKGVSGNPAGRPPRKRVASAAAVATSLDWVKAEADWLKAEAERLQKMLEDQDRRLARLEARRRNEANAGRQE